MAGQFAQRIAGRQRLQGRRVTVIAARSDVGLLYGSFAWLRAAQTGADLARLNERSSPRLSLRLLNHWDNLDRSVERGYAGASIWDWWKLPALRDARYTDYARANASLGINGTVLNNVNAKAESLTVLAQQGIGLETGVAGRVKRHAGARLIDHAQSRYPSRLAQRGHRRTRQLVGGVAHRGQHMP